MIRVTSISSCRNHIRRQNVQQVAQQHIIQPAVSLSSGSISQSLTLHNQQQQQQQQFDSSSLFSSRSYSSFADRRYGSTTTLINNIKSLRNNSINNSNSINPATTIQYRTFFWGTGKSKTTIDENVDSTNDGTTISSVTGTFTNNDDDSTTTTTTTTGSDTNFDVDQAIDKLFDESQIQEDAIAKVMQVQPEPGTFAWFTQSTRSIAEVGDYEWTPVWWNVADHGVTFLGNMHQLIGSDMAITIIVTTICLRTFLIFPFMVLSQKNGSRMAHLAPELTHLKKRYELLGTPSHAEQVQFLSNMKALFKKYDCNPAKQLIPVLQIPVLMGLFFGIRKLQLIYPMEMKTGGILWFTDLTVADPYLILPAVAATAMLLTIEVNKDITVAQDPERGEMMINFMRVMSIISIPILVSFEAGTLVYWCTNNTLTVIQAYTIKQRPVRKFFDIWDPPKPIPGVTGKKAKSIMETVETFRKRLSGDPITEKDIIKKHNATIEAKRNAIRIVRQNREARIKKM